MVLGQDIPHFGLYCLDANIKVMALSNDKGGF